ncbi:carbohydrate ABC transporter permease [Actinocorallia sp. API 0066]|uniref:carbohydrate ABC transporter permease n=1 Tax=Actinocorallia sp. API 0066 TaxID=2896846 RepID=UPI001E2B8729|nr:carbohydrate ABC transporter permease [Actinocorallia sp. API 0066]MCD0449227.1 carbohydrate ABC transporter permease [Actinocorallia sp. API 0066]
MTASHRLTEPKPRRMSPTSGTLVYLSLLAACVVVIMPLVVVLFTSLKTPEELARSGVLALPENWFNLANYGIAFERGRILTALLNTTIILVVSVTGSVLIGSMAAYAIDRFEFRLRPLVVGLFLFATLVPSITTQVTTFQVINGMGLFNSRLAPIVLYMGTDIIAIYIFLQFIRSIPKSVDEAARIDGASTLTIYWRVILPLLKPAIATVVIVKGITVYNDFYIPFLYMPDPDLGTMSTALFRFKGPFGAHWEAIAAGTILVIIPTLAVFLTLQRFIYNGMAKGSGK